MLRVRGAKQPVNAIAFAPTTQASGLLVSAGKDGYIRLWDRLTGESVGRWKAHDRAIFGLAFSPDGRLLASGSSDCTAKVWAMPGGELPATLKWRKSYSVSSVAFAPDGKSLIVASGNRLTSFPVAAGGVRLWNVKKWQPRFDVLGNKNSRQIAGCEVPVTTTSFGGVNTVQYTPDGKSVVLATSAGGVVLWDVGKNQQRAAFIQRNCLGAAITADGRTIVSADGKCAHLWDVATGKLTATLDGHTGRVRAVAFAPGGDLVLTGAADGSVRLWDTSGRQLAAFDWEIDGINAVAFAPDGSTAAAAGFDGTVVVWDVDVEHGAGAGPGTVAAPAAGPVDQGPGWMRVRHGKSVGGVAFAPDGKTVASTAFWDIVRLWDRATGRQRATLPRGKDKEVGSCLAFSPDGKTLATALFSTDAYVALWDLQAEERRTQFNTGNFSYGRRVTALAYSADGKRLACGTSRSGRFVSRPLEVRMQTAFGGQRVVIAESGGNVLGLAISPDGRLLAIGLEEGEIVLWDLAEGDRCENQPQKQGKGLSLAFSPDGKTLAGSIGRKVYLWDVESGEVRMTLAGHQGEVRSIVFAPDGRTLLTGSADRTVRRWDSATGKELAAYTWDIGLVNSVAVAPDGRSAAAGGNSGDVVIWDLDGPAGP